VPNTFASRTNSLRGLTSPRAMKRPIRGSAPREGSMVDRIPAAAGRRYRPGCPQPAVGAWGWSSSQHPSRSALRLMIHPPTAMRSTSTIATEAERPCPCSAIAITFSIVVPPFTVARTSGGRQGPMTLVTHGVGPPPQRASEGAGCGWTQRWGWRSAAPFDSRITWATASWHARTEHTVRCPWGPSRVVVRPRGRGPRGARSGRPGPGRGLGACP
jgi:hypothetical protein